MSEDIFDEFLPSLLSSVYISEQHGLDQIGRKNMLRYNQEIARADELSRARRIATGTAIVMFASSDKDNAFNTDELEENLGAAHKVERTLRQVGVDNPVEIVADYSRGDFERAMSDEGIGHLLFFGHTKRSGVFVPGDPILWRNTSPIDHLKKSVGVIGCGVYDRAGVTPRFGFNLVDTMTGILYGSPDGAEIMPSQMQDLGNFHQLQPRMLPSSLTSKVA
ncbi:MAG TPA: hypothetical protein PKD20_01420 [Candidatus Saccharibacteria bacterium]|jgi:hypothetical protein|nr:hypothetical protein [Candidatus Saccharibacteria bacterium]HMT55517.1 hypothetical protein [Candidatus Saccharibacteria bacterium]